MVTDFKEKKNEPIFPNAEQVKFDTLLNKVFVLKEYKTLVGDKGDFLVVLAEMDGKAISFATSSDAIVKHIKENVNSFPMRVKAIEKKSKNGRMYFDFASP